MSRRDRRREDPLHEYARSTRRPVRAFAALAALVYACSGEPSGARTASTVEPPRTVDTSYAPVIPNPAYPAGTGPSVCVDETHHNFHTSVGTYQPFSDVLRRDGYRVHRFTKYGPDALQRCHILVIADAQPPPRASDPPTFSSAEVRLLEQWVREGGSLLLVTDHQPDPGAIEGLAAAFGVEVLDGYVLNGPPDAPAGPLVFSVDDATLRDDPLLHGRGTGEEVTRVATFAGSALRGGAAFRALLVFDAGVLSWSPDEYYVFESDTPRTDVGGWSQGGVLEHGAGRVAVFGEAAMFTAQVFEEGTVHVGMNAPEARDNLQLLLNVAHWLSHLAPGP